jgi:MFS family permease
MDAVTLIAFVASMFVAGRMAERRGRSFKTWAWIAALIGPFAFPSIFLCPDLRSQNAHHA